MKEEKKNNENQMLIKRMIWELQERLSQEVLKQFLPQTLTYSSPLASLYVV